MKSAMMRVFFSCIVTTNFTIVILITLAGIYLLKVSNRNTRTRCEVYSKLITKTPGLVSLLLTLNIFIPCSSVSIINIEHVMLAEKASSSFQRYRNISSNVTCFIIDKILD